MAKEIVFTPTNVAVSTFEFQMSQVATNDPAINVLQNTIRNLEILSFLRTGQGAYTITLSLPVLIGFPSTWGAQKQINRTIMVTTGPQNIINIYQTVTSTGAFVDDVDGQTCISVKVYNLINKNM